MNRLAMIYDGLFVCDETNDRQIWKWFNFSTIHFGFFQIYSYINEKYSELIFSTWIINIDRFFLYFVTFVEAVVFLYSMLFIYVEKQSSK